MTSLELDFFDCLIKSVSDPCQINILSEDAENHTLQSYFGVCGVYSSDMPARGVYLYEDADFCLMGGFISTAVYDHVDSDSKIYYYSMDNLRKA